MLWWMDYFFDKTLAIVGLVASVLAWRAAKSARESIREFRMRSRPLEALVLAREAQSSLEQLRIAGDDESKRVCYRSFRRNMSRLLEVESSDSQDLTATIRLKFNNLVQNPSETRLSISLLNSMADDLAKLEQRLAESVRLTISEVGR